MVLYEESVSNGLLVLLQEVLVAAGGGAGTRVHLSQPFRLHRKCLSEQIIILAGFLLTSFSCILYNY